MRAETWTSGADLAWREPFGVAETPPEYVFLRPRLYLDTTIPSYLTARMSRDLKAARHQKITTQGGIRGGRISIFVYQNSSGERHVEAIQKRQSDA